MSKFPSQLDDDSTLPVVNDNINEIGGEAINALRDAVFAIEENIGLNANGTTNSIAERLSVAFFPDGTLNPSAITSLGLVTLPITNSQISSTAEIVESKLKLDHRTQDLFNYTRDLAKDTNLAIGWISVTGVKLQPHLMGALYRHILDQIDVTDDPDLYLKNKFNDLRNNSDSFELINDINSELLTHQWADGSPFTTPENITTYNGSVYPSNYGHTASGIFLNTSRFSTIPQTADDLQLFAEFLDSSSIFLYGTRIQNLYSNGISRVSRSACLSVDGYGAQIIPSTPAIAYLLNLGTNSGPFDDINTGDDIIEFKPSQADMDSNSFDEKFALVKIGDIVRINYGTVEVAYIIKEKKYKQESGNKKYIIRIAGKNLQYSPNASARIDKTLVNKNKYGVLAVAPANNTFSGTPSLIVGSPRGAQALGLGFNPDQFDETHYSLYLALYPTGFPQDGYTILPPIDVTGNRGTTPGKYTLESIVETTNNAFRQVGYNYRFIAFQYQGEFGIMLADSYLNSGFSILNAVVDPDGNYDLLGTNVNFQNNVVGVFSDTEAKPPDPLGFGSGGSNLASPPFMLSYGSAEAALNPTKLFLPLRRNNYYVNGTEREKMNLEVGQVLDGYGDGYWIGTVHAKNIFPGPSPTGRVQTTYRIDLNLQESNLKIGKTIVVQSRGTGGLLNFGRFIIQDITFGCSPNVFTDIQVYDAVHGTAVTPSTTVPLETEVAIYFNSDSISFNAETATDFNDVLTPFKRHFEIYVDQNSNTFTHERGRINTNNTDIVINDAVTLYTSTELSKLNIVKISPKLRGYQFGSVTKITLNVLEYSETTGQYTGQLGMYNGTAFFNKGPVIAGIKGEITRFYDESNVDYIDILFDTNVSMTSFTNHIIDFQLFPTLSLDDEVMMLATCQYDTGSNRLSMFRDERQFGNTSEKEFSTSALNFLSLPERLLHSNGVIRGFDMVEPESETDPNPFSNQIYLSGGMALVNGKFIQMNPQTVIIPPLREIFGTLFYVNWILCVNDRSEYQSIPMLDYDSVLGTPNNVGRRFQAFNVVNGLTYYLDANVFSDVVNKRKDLTPLYIVASQVIPSDPIAGPPTISMTLTDVRKYSQDIDNNVPLRLTTSDSQGNFKDPEAIFNWLKYNNVFNSVASIKGADTNSGLISSDLILDYPTSTIIDGENDAVLTLEGNVTFGSNLTLKNLEVQIFGTITTMSSVSNLRFENCTVKLFIPDPPPTDNVVFEIFNANNVSIEDCNIEVTYSGPYDSLQAFRGAVFRVNNSTGFKFINSSLAVEYSIVAGEVTPGDIFTFSDTDNVIITGSNFSGNFNKCYLNELSDNFTFTDSTITSSYCPDTGTPDSFNGALYDSTNNVNSGQGWMYFSVTSTLNNIKIDNVTFNYSPTNTSYSKERYSFINFELITGNCILSNVTISNCKFNNAITGGTNEDIRPAVAIVNLANQSTANNLQPVLLNVNIYNNTCNRNQSIIVTSQYNQEEQRMVYPGLAAIGVNISNNICGTIGYWVSSGSKVINISPNVNNLIDKTVGLTIQNNICHYISTLNEKGKFFRVSDVPDTTTVNRCDYPSGNVIIKNNKLNWVHVGISFAESSSLHIINNNFTAYNENYMEQFGDDSTTIYRGHGYAILVLSNTRVEDSNLTALGEGSNNDSACIIAGNTMSTGYWLQSTLTTFTYRYSAGYIYCQPSNSIHHNICKGIDDTTLGPSAPTPAFLVSGFTNDIHHNKIYRNGKTISAYIKFVVSDFPELFGGGNGTTGLVVDNYFDSPFVNSATLSESVIDIPDTSPAYIYGGWIAERNKNQTGFAVVPITNRALFDGAFPQWGPSLSDSTADILIGLMNDGGSLAVGPGSTTTGSYRSQSAIIVEDTVDDPINKMWGFQENVEKYLPNNVRIITVKQGLRGWESTVSYYTNPASIPPGTTNSNFFLNLSSLDNTVDLTDTNVFASVTSNDNNVVEYGLTSPVYSQITGGQINSTALNIPFSIDLENYDGQDLSNTYVTGRGKSITVSGDWRWVRSSSTLHITISPVVIKYRW